MTRRDFNLSAVFIVAVLVPGAGAAVAANESAPSTDSRYAVHGQQLERAATGSSIDGRYRLVPRLESEPTAAGTGGDFELRATLIDAKAVACSGGGNTIFANGFE